MRLDYRAKQEKAVFISECDKAVIVGKIVTAIKPERRRLSSELEGPRKVISKTKNCPVRVLAIALEYAAV